MSKQSKAETRAQKAAELRAQAKRDERRRQTITVVSVVAALVLIVGLGFLIMRLTADPTPTKLQGASDEYALALGEQQDNHEIVIYEDFLCPFCGQVEQGTRADLQKAIDAGTVYVEYRPFNLLSSLGDYSMRAANAFRVVQETSGDETAKKFHDLLFENQPAESGEMPSDDWLVQQAVAAGASEADVRPGIEGLEHEDWVNGATQDAANKGVNSTPTVYIDGELVQGTSVDDVVTKILDAAR